MFRSKLGEQMDDCRDIEPICRRCKGEGEVRIVDPNGVYPTDKITIDCPECKGE